MIKRRKLWYMMLFSIIFVLSIYYVTMPNDLLSTKINIGKKDSDKVIETIEEASSLVALRVNLQEERQEEMTVLQKQLTEDLTSDEKNEAYEKIKYLNQIESLEEETETRINKELGLDCFVKIDNTNINTVCISSKHDAALANKVMRLIQNGFDTKKYITVKFQKK
ncbi:MAG: hypothetical protein Q4E69_01305 [Bacilli bacterium]|nr:hypothetical protein [Bacilli bacterium]